MEKRHWIEQIKAQGMAEPLKILLDAIEPIAPLAAQMLYVMQPALGALGMHDAAGELARAFDEPDGIDALRQQLRNDES